MEAAEAAARAAEGPSMSRWSPPPAPTSPSPPALEERGQAEGRDRAKESKHVIIEIVLYMCQSKMTEIFLQDVLYTISLLKQATFNN